MIAGQEDLLLNSLQWPLSVPLGDFTNDVQWENVRAELEVQHNSKKFDHIDLELVFLRAKEALLAQEDKESQPLGSLGTVEPVVGRVGDPEAANAL